jgi:MFS family permease
LQWVVNAYLLPLGALLLLGGAAGDRFGRVRLLVVGTALFGAASVACALEPSLFWLLIARGIQGVGTALLIPNSIAILGAGFSGEAHGRAIGIWASTGAVMGALGPVLGGAGYSGAQAGAALLPFAAVLAIGSPLMGAVAGNVGSRAPLSIGSLIVAGGFLLILRIGHNADYWRTVFPAILVIAIGLAGAVAPLTTAILASVDSRHTGSASGLNSAVSRTGGMVATALLGGIRGAAGPALVSGFHAAAIACAIASIAASASAFLLIPANERETMSHGSEH